MGDDETVWAPIAGFEGFYEVSNTGLVRSLDRDVPGRGDFRQFVRGRVLTPGFAKFGYPRVTLYREAVRSSHNIHRLVAEAFVPGRAEGLEVLHKDDDPTNNHWTNLQWGTHAENMQGSVQRKRQRNTRKTHCVNGHPFNEENTAHYKNGHSTHRVCLPCRAEGERQKRAKSRGNA